MPVDDYESLNAKIVKDPAPETCPRQEPQNGLDVRCGPILRLCGTDDRVYRALMMLVVAEGTPRVTYRAGSLHDSTYEGEFPGTSFHQEHGYSFYRFEIKLDLAEYEQRVRYSVNGVESPNYQFFVPSVSQSMNVVSFSCNGFSLATETSGFKLLLWLDVLREHNLQHYHVMLGGGDQLYCDSIKAHCKTLSPWLETRSNHKKRHMEVTPEMQSDFDNYYLTAYLQWFGQGFWMGKNGSTVQPMFAAAMAQIPSVNIYDDHDIIDGFGSYKDKTMGQPIFAAIGNTAFRYYMLFQHQMSIDEEAFASDPLWILGNKGMFIKQRSHSVFMRLGSQMSLLGLDCRTERRLTLIISDETYKAVFSRVERELQASTPKHLLVMLGVPILYPRLVWLEWLLTLSVLKPVRKLAAAGVISKGLVNEFDGSVEVLDDLNDHWCLKHHKRERNALIQKLTALGAQYGVRITILLGDVHLCCVGRLHGLVHKHAHAHLHDVEQENRNVLENPEFDPRLVMNVISSAIVNAPPPDAMANLLNSRLKVHHYDRNTDEDMVPLFTHEPSGAPRQNHQFLNKRNWSDLVVAKQLVRHKDYVNEGQRLVPGPVGQKNKGSLYPLLPESLVATIHVEKEGNHPKAATAGYEVVIPELAQKTKLEKTHVKHLGE